MSFEAERDLAANLFKSFHGRAPKNGEIMQLDGTKQSTIVLEVGTLVSLGYKSAGDGEIYYHEFEHVKPKLYVTGSGRQAYVIGGSYLFTDRGFVK